MTFLGLLRKRFEGESIRDVLDTEAGRKCCRNLSINIADRIQDYLENKTRILAVLGGNPESPGCAIHFESSDKDKKSLAIQSGVFMKEFHKELCRRSIEVPFRGIRDYDSELIKTDLEWLEQVFAS
jgi:predicted secreted protein